MTDIYKNIEEYNPNKKGKILIFFDDRNAEMLSNKRLNPIVIELFIKGIKLNISLVLITQSYFAVPKYIRLNSTLYVIRIIPNKLQQIAFNHSPDTDFKDFINVYKKCIAKKYSYLVTDATLASDNPFCFRKNLLKTKQKLIKTTDDKIRDEKLQYDIRREAAKYQHYHMKKMRISYR